jgi:hypothetical protein
MIYRLNIGGETHTFTEVGAFGNGFVAALNESGEPTVSECTFPAVAHVRALGRSQPSKGALARHAQVPVLHPPWMQTVIKVEAQ